MLLFFTAYAVMGLLVTVGIPTADGRPAPAVIRVMMLPGTWLTSGLVCRDCWRHLRAWWEGD
jgi:hypothetical protein